MSDAYLDPSRSIDSFSNPNSVKNGRFSILEASTRESFIMNIRRMGHPWVLVVGKTIQWTSRETFRY